jgi:MoxR-like ATPase
MIPEGITRVLENMQKVIVGKEEVLEMMLSTLLCEGHILIEDVPGIGKTVLSKSLAQSIGCTFSRIQCTPDLLPSDITGTFYFDQKVSEFVFRPGPVMSNIVLVDEINRATSRTQSSFLESMQERQITVDGVTMPLPRPFLVIATQNPVELQGTFPLPEAQLDRFLLRLSLGYPTEDEEDRMILRFHDNDPLETLSDVTSGEEILRLISLVHAVHVDHSIRRYILEITRRTRIDPLIKLGASPRASLALYKVSQALAFVQGRDYVMPDDVKRLVAPVLGHRLILSPDAYLTKIDKEDLLERILFSIPVPVED